MEPETVRQKYSGSAFDISTVNVKLTGFEAYEKLGYSYVAVLSGSANAPGKYKSVIESVTIFSPDHEDVTDQFLIEKKKGTIHLYESVLICRSEDVDMIYNGLPADLNVLLRGTLSAGHTIQYIPTANADVGTKANSFNVRIVNAYNQDVTDHYFIQKNFGTVTISPLQITVKALDAQKPYDGTELTSNAYEITVGGLAYGHSISKIVFQGSQTEIGRSENTITEIRIENEMGEDVSANYIIEIKAGKLKVTGR